MKNENKAMTRVLSLLLVCAMMAAIVIVMPMTVEAADDYPQKYKDKDPDEIVDEWNFYNRECTSFVAWRLNNNNGIEFTNQYGGLSRWGYAYEWKAAAETLGIKVDMNPAVGAVAWNGQNQNGAYSTGHIAWVSAVNGNNVTVEEYNWSTSGGYGTRTVDKSKFAGYIHIKDLNGKFLAPITPVQDLPDFSEYVPISSRAELEAIANNLSGKYYLTNDIDLGNEEWVPIGSTTPNVYNTSKFFRGIFDGQGYVISNLKITNGVQSTEIGLFGVVSAMDASIISIKNVGVSGQITVTAVTENGWRDIGGLVGGLVGYVYWYGHIENCFSQVNIDVNVADGNGNCVIGGLVGRLDATSNTSSISNSFYDGNIEVSGLEVSGYGVISGGLCGSTGVSSSARPSFVTVQKCYNSGNISVITSTLSLAGNMGILGGIIGGSGTTLSLLECYNTGNIENTSKSSAYTTALTGGLVGSHSDNNFNLDIDIKNCFNTGNVTATTHSNGSNGLAAISHAGGLVGKISFSGGSGARTYIENCYNIGDVIASAYATLNVPDGRYYSFAYCGGIFGYADRGVHTIENCAIAPNVLSASAELTHCNVVGYCYDDDDPMYYEGLMPSWYSIKSNNYTAGDIISGITTNDADITLSRSAFLNQTTWENIGFDFDSIWMMPSDDGYPIFQWQNIISLSELVNSKFQSGLYWNNDSGSEQLSNLRSGDWYADSVTSKPCVSHPDNMSGFSVRNSCNSFQGATQCAGFVNMLAYNIYGVNPNNTWDDSDTQRNHTPAPWTYLAIKDESDLDLKAGDVIRIGGHSVFVLASREEDITVIEVNNDYTCQIQTRSISKKTIMGYSTKFAKIAPFEADASKINGLWGKFLSINCPVDVEVYTKNGDLAARIVNNIPDYNIAIEKALAVSVVGDEKTIILPDVGNYIVKFTGTDVGTMDFSVSDINMVTYSESDGSKEFTNIALVPGKQMYSEIGGEVETPDVRLFVTDTDGKIIEEIIGVTVETPPSDSLKGHVLGNEKIGIGDAQLAFRAALKLVDLTNDQLYAADIDGNGRADMSDAMRIFRYALGLSNEL